MATETAMSPLCLHPLSSNQIYKKILFNQYVKNMNYADSTILKRKLAAWFNVNEETKLVVCLIKLNTCQPGTVSTEVKPPPTLPKENKFIAPYKCSVHIQTLCQPHTDATKLIIYLFLLSHLLLSFISTTSLPSCLMATQVDSERLFLMRLLSDD